MKQEIKGEILPYNLHDCVMVEIFDDNELVNNFLLWQKDIGIHGYSISVGRGNLTQIFTAADREDIEEFFNGV